MLLNGILTREFTDEEYLAHQRELHKERCEKTIAWIKKDVGNTTLIDKMKKEAEYSLKNLFILPGTRGVRFDVGTPPAWWECRTDDEEYLWVLNRMHWFNNLVKLYHITGERMYAEKVMTDMLDWIDNCPPGVLPDENTTKEQMLDIRRFYSGVTPWRSLEVGIRMFDSWNYAYDCLLHTDLMTPEAHTKIVCSFYQHALVLRTMSPIYWPKADHNHYLHEMLGLLNIACIFPDMINAEVYREFAIRELVRCAKAQFSEDGGQVEGSPGYHGGCLRMFFTLIETAKTFGIALPDDILDMCKKATDYIIMATGPDGILTPFGDTGCSSVCEDIARRYYTAFGELGSTAKIFAIHPSNDPDVIPEEVQQQARELAASAGGEDNLQRQIDQYFARTGWTRDDSHFGFMCHSPVCNGHSHIDPCTFTLYLKGDLIVVDPSHYTYRECEDRKRFKSPEYHSTITFDDKPPYTYVSRWSFGPQKEGRIRSAYRLPGVFAADASHHGYDPDYHKRLCALVGDDVFLVADDVINVTGAVIRLYFHMDDPEVKVEGRLATSSRINVLIPEGVSAESVPAERSFGMDIARPSSRLIFTDDSGKSRQYLTVFTKRDDISEPKIERVKDGIEISYKQGSERVAFLWSFTSSLKKI